MRKNTLLLVLVVLASFNLLAQRITFKKSSNASGEFSMRFELSAQEDNQDVKIHWGNIVKTYKVRSQKTFIDSEISIAPSTIVVIEGDIAGFSMSDEMLEFIDLSQCAGLKELELSNAGLKKIDLSCCKELVRLDLNSNELPLLNLNSLENLEYLNLGAAGVVELDIDKCAKLKLLNIPYNDIETLTLHKDAKLNYLKATAVKLSSFNFSNQTELETVEFGTSMLKEVDLSNSKKLRYVNFEFSKRLAKINLPSDCQSMDYLNVSACALESLEVKGMPNLTKLNCSQNKIQSLDLSNCIKLKELYCSMNELKNLDLSKNQKLKELFCANNGFSAKALNKIYRDLPKLPKKPENPNLFNGGSNQFSGAKSYIAELKNWYITDSGNGGGGKSAAFFSHIGSNDVMEEYDVTLSVVGLTSSSKLYYDKGDEVDTPIELQGGKAEIKIKSNGILIVSGPAKEIEISGITIYKGDLKGMPTLQKIDLSNSRVRDLKFAENSALKSLILRDNPEMTYLLLGNQPQLNYIDIRNCNFSTETMNTLFKSLPKLKEFPSTPNILIEGNVSADRADYSIAKQKNWRFDIPASTAFESPEEVQIKTFNGNIIISASGKAIVELFAMDGLMLQKAYIDESCPAVLSVAHNGSFIVRVLMEETGRQLIEKIQL